MGKDPSWETQLLNAATADIKVLDALLAQPEVRAVSAEIYKQSIQLALKAADQDPRLKRNVDALLKISPLTQATLNEMEAAIKVEEKATAVTIEQPKSKKSAEEYKRSAIPRNPTTRSR
jgi:hypothetical protein